MNPEKARASIRPGDVVETTDFGVLRVVHLLEDAFYGWQVDSGETTTRIEDYANIEEYRPRERLDEENVHFELFGLPDDEDRRSGEPTDPVSEFRDVEQAVKEEDDEEEA